MLSEKGSVHPTTNTTMFKNKHIVSHTFQFVKHFIQPRNWLRLAL